MCDDTTLITFVRNSLYHSYYVCTKLIVPLLSVTFVQNSLYHSYYLRTKLATSCDDEHHTLLLSQKLRYPRRNDFCFLFVNLVRNSQCRVTIPLLLPLYETRGTTLITFVLNSGYRVAISLFITFVRNSRYHSYYLCTKLGISCGYIALITLYKTRDFVWLYHFYYLCSSLYHSYYPCTKHGTSCGDITLYYPCTKLVTSCGDTTPIIFVRSSRHPHHSASRKLCVRVWRSADMSTDYLASGPVPFELYLRGNLHRRK